MRTALLLALALGIITGVAATSACKDAQGSKLDAAPAQPHAPKNLVCERFKAAPQTTCASERIDEGELHTHAATVTQKADKGEVTLSCLLNDRSVSVVCGPTIVVQQEQVPEVVAPSKPAPVKMTPAKGAKK